MDNNSANSIVAAAVVAVREVRLNLLRAARMDSDQPLAHNFSLTALEWPQTRRERRGREKEARGGCLV